MGEYIELLQHLLAQTENEVVEFKAARDNFDIDDLGRYFSALSNEAYDVLENSLPGRKDEKGKRLFLSRLLKKMSDENLLSASGRTWHITENGEKRVVKKPLYNKQF